MPSNSTHDNPTVHGSAAWVSPAQGGLVARAPGRSILALGDAGGTLFRRRRTWGIETWPTGRNWIVLGPPRSGKGAGLFVPALLEAPEHDPRPTLVVTDPKGELLALAGPVLTAAGYAVHPVAFDRPDLSGPWNPLGWLDPAVGAPQDAPDYGSVAALAEAMAPKTSMEKDPFWVNQAQVVAKASAVLAWHLARRRDKGRATLVDVLALAYATVGNEPLVNAVADAALQIDPWAASQLAVYGRGLADAKLAGNLAADLSSRIHSWTTPSMLGVLDAPPDTWDAADILSGDQPHAVFVLATAGQSSEQAVLWGSVIAAAHRIQRRQNRLPRPLWLLLDEAGNVGQIPGLADALATLPGAGVSIVLGLQAQPQLSAVYGAEEGAIIGAMHGYIALPGLGHVSAGWVSQNLGETTATHHKRSTTGQGAAQWDTQISQRALLTPDEVSRLAADRMIVHRLGSGPTALRMRPYYTEARWAAQAKIADPVHPQIAEALAAYRAGDRPAAPGLTQRANELFAEMGLGGEPADAEDAEPMDETNDMLTIKKTWSVPLG